MSIATTHVSIGTAKRELSKLGNQVVYGGKRIIVTSRGKPKFAIVNLEELGQRLVDRGEREMRKQQQLAVLEKAQRISVQIQRETGGDVPDSVEMLHELRHERDRSLAPDLY